MENPIQMDDESWGTPLQSIKAKYGLPMDWGIPSAVGQTMRALNDGGYSISFLWPYRNRQKDCTAKSYETGKYGFYSLFVCS